ncbi:hypothetical protein Corgl_1192 [Coriobacterium glomerans PW2]|uniref:O-antigen polymerase n=1 Tax=Coriobacterium glomerans (strain ATCC 49209 / DSM 20642 / JCM 10262 / PW2) TaxID=700015 RepID=F2N8B2_CORGP|nr:O-antigen ligase family protein [Coriobacterium glomerans]AEB07295.1 hypothetical protein Corgl_1192 [Coriobacterium glomerans PW2]
MHNTSLNTNGVCASSRHAEVALERFDKRPQSSAALSMMVLKILFAIMPVVDSLNGWLNEGGNEGGITLGILYRCAIMLTASGYLVSGRRIRNRRSFLLPILLFTVLVPHLLNLLGSMSFLSLSIKTLLPVVCIEVFVRFADAGEDMLDFASSVFSTWAVLLPLCILIPYFLGFGFTTYGESGGTGFKGFFYAQNDLAFFLVTTLGYTAYRFTSDKKIRYAALVLALMACVVLLGLKSAYIVAALYLVYFFVLDSNLSTIQKIGGCVVLVMCAIFGFLLFSSQVAAIAARWSFFYNKADNFLTFFTSSRIDRIPVAMKYLDSSIGPMWRVFGAGDAYSVVLKPYSLVEMDYFDLYFQFGLIGAVFFGVYYASFFHPLRKCIGPLPAFLRLSLFVALVMAALAGHVFNTALSGMVLAVICCGINGLNNEGTARGGWRRNGKAVRNI